VDAYRIEKERLSVSLTLVGGEQLRGYIFVQPPTIGRSVYEGPVALFNESDPFFPIELEAGDVLLLAKSHVLEISGLPITDEDSAFMGGAPMALLEITMVGGVAHFGSMRLEVRADRPRLLDYLNDYNKRFLTLYTDNGVRLVNRALIERVRPLD
jgi:hypothetical protein